MWLWLYHDVLRRLVDDWRVDENYSHGFLIPFIGGYAIWTQRRRLAALPVKPQFWLGGVSIVAAVALHLAGVLTGELYASRLSLVISLAGLTLYFGGWAWLRALAFPIGLLLLALPVPSIIFNPLAFRLQLLASDYATRVIQLCGIPALREGNIIELAALKLQVVEACSGIRSLMMLATLAVVYAYFFESQWWRRILLVLAVPPIAVLTNAARVAVTGVLAHTQGAAVAEGFLHGFSGALVFVAAVLCLLAWAQILEFAAKLWLPRR
ncbi:MAG: exosortase [Acidobacteria bacterium]|nr:exosortase [Acidobacteriota bacterium]MBI3423946.1 exosortase [Acidobacteriota bacterium]